jgi:myo-inositol-1(or 4)-monophosphatase
VSRPTAPPGRSSGASPPASPGELRLLAEQLARSAGAQASAGRRRLGVGQHVSHDTKSTSTDPVTEFDRAAESLIVGELRRLRSSDTIVGEEGADHPGDSGLEWHVDPIDGTVNFVYDLPMWCTSIGVLDEFGGLAGAVYVPVLDEMFSAARGEGATLNGEPITASSAASINMALVGTGFSYDGDRRRSQAMRVASMLPQVRDIRRFGSAAIDLCLVACGRIDGYFEQYLNSWDIAAGVLIASEAGATCSDFAGGRPSTDGVVVSAPAIHAPLLQLIDT